MKIDWKKVLPHVVAICVFLGVSVAYFYPALEGYVLKTHDIKMHKGMSKEIQDYRAEHNAEPLWTNSMFGGMPATQISVRYDTNLMGVVYKVITLNLPRPISIVWLYFIGFYILLMCLKIDPWLAIVGALAFGFSSYFFIVMEAGHMSKANAIAFMAPTIGGVILTYRRKLLLGVGVTALFMSLELWANHYQVTFYMMMIIAAFGISELFRHVKEKELSNRGVSILGRISGGGISGILRVIVKYGLYDFGKRTLVVFAAIALALLVNLGSLWGTSEYTKHTTRGKSELTVLAPGKKASDAADKTSGLDRSYVTAWSYGTGETFTLLVADAKGGGSVAFNSLHKAETEKAVKELQQGPVNPTMDNIAANFTQGKQNASMYFSNILASDLSYWGSQGSTSGPVYVGAIIFFLFLLSLTFVTDKMKWALFAVTLLTIMLSWGKNYVSALVILPVLLFFVVALVKEKYQLYTSLGIVIVLVVLFAMGESTGVPSLTNFFLDYIPGYNKFRAVTIILVVAELTIPLLAILFLKKLIDNRETAEKNMLLFYIPSGLIILVLFVAAVSPETFFNFPDDVGRMGGGYYNQIMGAVPDNMKMEVQNYFEMQYKPQVSSLRIDIFTSDVWRSLIFILLACATLLLFIKQKINKNVLIAIIGVLIVVDLWLVDSRYLNNEPGVNTKYESWIEKDHAKKPFHASLTDMDILSQEIQENLEINKLIIDKVEEKQIAKGEQLTREEAESIWFSTLNINTNYRVYSMNNPFNDAGVSYFHKSIGGYHGAKLKRYQELIEFHIGYNNQKVLDMLNTKYLVGTVKSRITQADTNIVERRSSNLGNAWFVNEVKMVENADAEILALADSAGFDPENIAVVDKKFASQLEGEFSKDTNGSILLEEYQPNFLKYQFNAASDQLVIFSEVFYDLGWQAYIDGKPVDHFRANFILRGLKVPAGEHEITFKYELKSFSIGSTVSLIGSLLLFVLISFVAFKLIANAKKDKLELNS